MKIIDFGQSCLIGTAKERIQGTPEYIAPEHGLPRRSVIQVTPGNDNTLWCAMPGHVAVIDLILKQALLVFGVQIKGSVIAFIIDAIVIAVIMVLIVLYTRMTKRIVAQGRGTRLL